MNCFTTYDNILENPFLLIMQRKNDNYPCGFFIIRWEKTVGHP